MSVSYKNIKSNRQWRATTGLSEPKFHQLAHHFGKAYESIFGMDIVQRQRNSTSDARFRTYEDLLFFVLFSLKSGLTYDALGFTFGLRGGNAKANQTFGLRILKTTLHQMSMLPEQGFDSVGDMRKVIPKGSTILIDGEEQRMQRPVDEDFRAEVASGKKKTSP